MKEDGHQVSIKDMMDCRDQRVEKQNAMLAVHHAPLVSFCLNIPGPVKTDPQIRAAFEIGKKSIEDALSECSMEILDAFEKHEKTGDELMLSIDADAEKLKTIMSRIEDTHPLGRLFDIDIIGTDGQKLSRARFRTCLLCSRQAQECARTRRHPVQELFDKAEEMISSYLADKK